MKIHFLYPHRRNPEFEALKRGEYDVNWYGMRLLSKKHETTSLWNFHLSNKFLRFLHRALFKWFYFNSRSPIGFSLIAAYYNRKLANDSDICFAVNDSIAVGALFLKKIGIIKKPIIIQCIGTSELFNGKLEIKKLNKIRKRISILFNEAVAIVSLIPSETEVILKNSNITSKNLFSLKSLVGWEARYKEESKNNFDGDYILSIGADSQRDFDLLLECADRIPCKIIIIAGSNPFPKNLPSNVTLLRKIPFNETTRYLNNCKFFVLPIKENKYTAGFKALLQAMMLGKAVIVSEVSALKCFEQFIHLKNCYKIAPHSKKSLIDGIIYLLQNKKIRDHIGCEGQRMVLKHFTLEHYVQKIEDVFKLVYAQKIGGKLDE